MGSAHKHLPSGTGERAVCKWRWQSALSPTWRCFPPKARVVPEIEFWLCLFSREIWGFLAQPCCWGHYCRVASGLLEQEAHSGCGQAFSLPGSQLLFGKSSAGVPGLSPPVGHCHSGYFCLLSCIIRYLCYLQAVSHLLARMGLFPLRMFRIM